MTLIAAACIPQVRQYTQHRFVTLFTIVVRTARKNLLDGGWLLVYGKRQPMLAAFQSIIRSRLADGMNGSLCERKAKGVADLPQTLVLPGAYDEAGSNKKYHKSVYDQIIGIHQHFPPSKVWIFILNKTTIENIT